MLETVTEVVGMAGAVQELQPGQAMIGFMKPDGTLIGPLVDAADKVLGDHGVLADMYMVRGGIKAGTVIPITVGKDSSGQLGAYGSGTFDVRLTPAQKALALRNVK